jgi:hypothetical protein
LIMSVFEDTPWTKAFFSDSHHGYIHWNQVKEASLKLVEKLTNKEEEKLVKEGKYICKINPYEWSLVAITIASIFHDSGRINNRWEITQKEQKIHHILSAKRAKQFCKKNELVSVIHYVEDAILWHDFQSKKLTPFLTPPKTIIWKIVQSSDQLWWFHPDSLDRTLEYNKSLWIPFCDLEIPFNKRLKWKPLTKSKDALTVMLNQLFWPTWKDRFAIKSARQKVETYKIELEAKIIELGKLHNLEEEVSILIEEYKKYYK